MKNLWNSFALAFSMYSISPKAQLERSRDNTKYILVVIPWIGLIIGFIICEWAIAYPYICDYALLPAVVGAVLPSILSAGSHLDGFFRTVDALCSHQPRERKLEILEDSHGGYFAIIVCVCYFLLAIGIWSEMPIDGIFVIAYMYVISRSIYGLSILAFKHAKESKCSVYVPEGTLKLLEMVILVIYTALAFYKMYAMNPKVALATCLGTAITFLYFLYTSYKHFGGVTEDSAGFFVQICEVMIPLAALIAYKQWW
ncbi:MAG: adenosylcobinamide-GDP ribazoletransferase [Lachnospiraceae bacterium]|nr:adenosylcobinamide-GDP ribazoletransferase [Lachnospiraceae bacterium]